LDRLRIGLIGAGHFGRFHALKLAAASRAVLSGIADPDTGRARAVALEAGCEVRGVAELLALSDAVIIAAPAELHFELAAQALQAGKHVLVEKPIAATLDQAVELAGLARTANKILQVGHLERFSAAFGAVTARMGKPLYIEAVRVAPFKPRGTDVSVILDLMIHDLDLILALVDQPIDHVDAVGASVASAHEDIANARIKFSNGAVATITASRISLKTERKMRIFSQTGYLTVDFSARKLTWIRRAGRITTRSPPNIWPSSPRSWTARRWPWMPKPAAGRWRLLWRSARRLPTPGNSRKRAGWSGRCFKSFARQTRSKPTV
jgi:predicted dehydrogenase